jgi:hypothetical protein
VNPTSIALGMLLVLLTVVLLYRKRKLKPQIARYGTQTMCPFCGLITSRLKESCTECGKSYTRRVFNGKKMSRHHVRRPLTSAGKLKVGTNI